MVDLSRATIKEIADALGISKSQAERRASSSIWPFEEVPLPTGNRRRLYPLATLPAEVRKALTAKALTTSRPAPVAKHHQPVPDAASLKTYQRRPMEARAILLAEIDRLVLNGSTQGEAVTTLVDSARGRELAPELQRAVATANARGNASRSLTRATVYNWLKARRENGGAVEALAPAAAEEAPIPTWAATFFNLRGTPQNPSITMVLEDLWPEGEDRPSIDQVRRFLKKVDAISLHIGRVGPRDLRKYRAFHARDVSELWPGAVFCGDGHTFKAEVAHPIHGRPFRPEITLMVDVYSRRIVGWSVALAENTSSVADALRHAVTTATSCDILYYDNGSGAKNAAWDDQVTGLAARLYITKKHSIAYNSQARGVVERRNSTVLHRAAKKLATYVGQDMDREARQQAYKITRKDIREVGTSRLLPSWAEFVALIEAEIAAANARECDGLPKIADREAGRRRHMSPDEVWAKAIADGWTPDPISPEVARDLFRPVEIRKARRALVELFGNEYFGGAPLERLHGEDVQVSYDIHDATKVWVRDREGRFICEAIWNGHKTSYFPVSQAQLAHEQRVAGMVKRHEGHIAVAKEELRAPMIEHQPMADFIMPMAVADADCITVSAAHDAPPMPARAATARADGRPVFSDDMGYARWLMAHPTQVTNADRELLRQLLRNSSFRSLLDFEGVDATALRELSQSVEAL